jgi:ABC-type cobalamin/Fe3+-siderophores transport system ATPase subunit
MTTLLAASNLSFAYCPQRPVLRDISLTLSPGESICLIGPNGSGKSTLLKVLLGQLRAAGTIMWENRPLNSWTRRDLAKRIAYLPQTPTSDPDHRVIDVLRLGRAPYWSAFGIESPRDAHVVTNVVSQLGLEDLLERRMDELSGGQRQRVFVGRCLAQEPAALLLDEPNTYLDLRHQVELSTLLRRLCKESNVAILMASHDLNLAAITSDRLILLHNGKVAAAGPASEVMQPDLLERVYGVAMDRIERPGSAPVVLPAQPSRLADDIPGDFIA